ncbi:MAG: hypothetical protein LBP27_03155 [Treponema sp.]|jgi:hypothetical protein|nr:hypothetical protein [Treponema sp.]
MRRGRIFRFFGTVFRIVFFLFSGLFFSCSRTAPEISYGFVELVYYQGPEKPEERFSFFIIPDDEDGIENLDELYLYHDREQLRWLVKSEDWVSFEQDGKTWIGSRSIAPEEGETLPRGQYRVLLVNKGGERSERPLVFDAPDEPRFPFPSLEIAGGYYLVNSAYPENRLVCYDAQGNYVSTQPLSVLSGRVRDLSLPDSARTAALWAEDPLYFTSAFTDVISLR